MRLSANSFGVESVACPPSYYYRCRTQALYVWKVGEHEPRSVLPGATGKCMRTFYTPEIYIEYSVLYRIHTFINLRDFRT